MLEEVLNASENSTIHLSWQQSIDEWMIDKVSKQINIRTYSVLKQNWIILFNFSNFCNSLQVSYFIVITFLANNVMRNLIRGTWSLDMFCKLTQNGNKKIKKLNRVHSCYLIVSCSWKLDFFFVLLCFVSFLSRFSFTDIHESQDCRGRGRAFL